MGGLFEGSAPLWPQAQGGSLGAYAPGGSLGGGSQFPMGAGSQVPLLESAFDGVSFELNDDEWTDLLDSASIWHGTDLGHYPGSTEIGGLGEGPGVFGSSQAPGPADGHGAGPALREGGGRAAGGAGQGALQGSSGLAAGEAGAGEGGGPSGLGGRKLSRERPSGLGSASWQRERKRPTLSADPDGLANYVPSGCAPACFCVTALFTSAAVESQSHRVKRTCLPAAPQEIQAHSMSAHAHAARCRPAERLATRRGQSLAIASLSLAERFYLY